PVCRPWRRGGHAEILGEPNTMLRACPWRTQDVGSIGWRQFTPHRVIAAVDVQKLACGQVEIIRKDDADRTSHRGFVLQVPAQGRTLFPNLFEILEPGDAAGREGCQGSGADRVDANLVAAEVPRQ